MPLQGADRACIIPHPIAISAKDSPTVQHFFSMQPPNPSPNAADNEWDAYWMRQALALAELAGACNEVPVGAVLVRDQQVIGQGWNQPILAHDPSAHAEILALRAAGRAVGNYRLPGSVLYVTLEPCPMCAGALIHARVQRLVFAAADPRTGAAGSVYSLLQDPRHNHAVAITSGVLAQPCGALLAEFFQRRRAEHKLAKSVVAG